MLKYIVKRIISLLPVILGATLIVFLILNMAQGDPARMILGDEATQEQVEGLREELGLNDPVMVQYGRYMLKLVQGDFGTSYSTGQPVLNGSRGNEYPHQFSGGMKQRVVIAMALACSPHLLIADEPTTALDVTIQAQVLEMMKELKKKYQMSLLMITHDLGIVADICDTVAIIYAGRIVEYGTLSDIFEYSRHPYTKGLFGSLPNLKDRMARLKPIRGLMPDPTVLTEGCAFADRCDYVCAKCFHEIPHKLYRNKDHYVKCHLYDPENINREVIAR